VRVRHPVAGLLTLPYETLAVLGELGRYRAYRAVKKVRGRGKSYARGPPHPPLPGGRDDGGPREGRVPGQGRACAS